MILPVVAAGPGTNTDFLFISKISFEDTSKIFENFHVGLKLEWGLRDKYPYSWKHLLFEVFFSCPLISSGSNLSKHAGGHSVTTEACTSLADGHSVATEACTSLACVREVWRSGSSLELSVLCIWANATMLLIRPLGTKFNEISIEIHTFSFTLVHLKMSSGKWQPFCLGFDALIRKTHQQWITGAGENAPVLIGGYYIPCQEPAYYAHLLLEFMEHKTSSRVAWFGYEWIGWEHFVD